MSTVDITGAVWRKSSYSGQGNNGDCVEVAFLDHASWRKSSYSGNGNNDNCIEVAFAGPMIAVRDSKNPAAGVLALHSTGWRSFLRTIG